MHMENKEKLTCLSQNRRTAQQKISSKFQTEFPTVYVDTHNHPSMSTEIEVIVSWMADFVVNDRTWKKNMHGYVNI